MGVVPVLLHDLELSTGMRWGEVSALRVGDISFAGIGGERQANIHVVRAWSQEPSTSLGRGDR